MYYERDILKKIETEINKPEILILLGSRQVGKTTILKLIQEKEKKFQIIFLDLDLEINLEYFDSYESILDYIKIQGFDPYKDKILLLLDEFQRVTNCAKTLKNLYDHHKNIKIIATGSSSFEINKRITESLAGRKKILRIYPLSFREYLLFKEQQNLLKLYDQFKINDNYSEIIEKEYQFFLTNNLIFGSYPQMILEQNPIAKGEKIFDLLNSYLRKDIREQMGIEDTILFKKVLEFLGITIGNLLNIASIAREFGSNYNKIKNYIDIAGETYILDFIRPYFKNRIKEIIKNPKIYFEDNGIRNFLIKNMNTELNLRTDFGSLVENFVYNEIKKQLDIYSEIKFWRNKNDTEIDFIIIKNKKLLPIEVKSGSFSNIPLGLLNFCEEEKLDQAIILNKNISQTIQKKGINFIFVPYIFSSKLVNLLA